MHLRARLVQLEGLEKMKPDELRKRFTECGGRIKGDKLIPPKIPCYKTTIALVCASLLKKNSGNGKKK